MEINKIYRTRFEGDRDFRNRMWQVLCADFFQKYIPCDSVLLELAPGYCEFINNIRAGQKFGVDINPDTLKFASAEVKIISSVSTDLSFFKNESVDVIFMSNFLEHLTRQEISATFRECHRTLKKGGRMLILQPNIRYLYRDYWMFFDHITPVDDRALAELLLSMGFSGMEISSRFLPYTSKGRLPKSIFLLKLYLRLPFLHFFFGKQSFIKAEKS